MHLTNETLWRPKEMVASGPRGVNGISCAAPGLHLDQVVEGRFTIPLQDMLAKPKRGLSEDRPRRWLIGAVVRS